VLAGITSLLVNGQPVLLTEALVVAAEELMGGFSPSWPLTKVLDIGGVERRPQFSDSSLSSTGKQYMACFHPVLQKVHSTEGNYYMYIGFVMDLSAICTMFSQYHSVVHNLLHHFLPCLPPSPSFSLLPSLSRSATHPLPCACGGGEGGTVCGSWEDRGVLLPPIGCSPIQPQTGTCQNPPWTQARCHQGKGKWRYRYIHTYR